MQDFRYMYMLLPGLGDTWITSCSPLFLKLHPTVHRSLIFWNRSRGRKGIFWPMRTWPLYTLSFFIVMAKRPWNVSWRGIRASVDCSGSSFSTSSTLPWATIIFGLMALIICKVEEWQWVPSLHHVWPIFLWPNGRRTSSMINGGPIWSSGVDALMTFSSYGKEIVPLWISSLVS